MYSRERQDTILHELSTASRVTVSDLADQLDVSTETIRRDLARLEQDGRLERTHGGAVPVTPGGRAERALAIRSSENTTAKRAIGARALELLPPPGGSVLIDAGSTTAQLAAGLRDEHAVTVITGSCPIASTLAAAGLPDLHLYGGQVRPLTGACVGHLALTALSRLRCDVVFLGTNGVATDRGLTTPHPDEAAVKRAMISAARRVVVLADSAKFGPDHLVTFGMLDDIDVIVTDSEPRGLLRTAIDDAGIEVLLP